MNTGLFAAFATEKAASTSPLYQATAVSAWGVPLPSGKPAAAETTFAASGAVARGASGALEQPATTRIRRPASKAFIVMQIPFTVEP